MSNEVQQINNLQPASFSKRLDTLTDGQTRILDLLKERIKDNKPITTEDIVDCYFGSCSKDGETIRVRGNLSYGTFYCNHLPKDHPDLRPKAISWFKLNLGSCITKGRLLVIPIIDI